MLKIKINQATSISCYDYIHHLPECDGVCEVEQREVVTLGDVVQGRRQVPARVQGHPGHVTRDDKTRDT